MNFVKPKATKYAREVPTDFPEIKLAFLKRIVLLIVFKCIRFPRAYY
jgi:hypothetical protein